VLAAGGIRLLPAFFQSGGLLVANSGGQPVANEFLLDARVVAFTLLVSLATVLFFGLLPAVRLSKLSPGRAVKDGTPSARGGVLRGPGLLVSAQVALSFILLMSAGLLARTLIQAMHADLGFERKNVLLLEMVPPGNHEHAMAFYGQLVERLRSLPGAGRACVTLHPPMAGYGGGFSDQVVIPGYLLPPGGPKLEIRQNRVSSGYFELLGVRLLRGRFFDAHDTEKSRNVAVINQTMAQHYFAGQDPVGHVIRVGLGDKARDTEIVGVVRDIRVNTIEEQPEPYIFLAYSQAANWTEATLMVETTGDPMHYANAVRRAGLALSPEVDISPPTTLEDIVQDRLQGSRTTATAVGILAMLGLILASIGLYGVMSYSVARRTRELGIRMALGANLGDTVSLVLRRGMSLAGVGAAAGVVGALAATRLLAHMLYNVSPYDPVTLAGVLAVMVAVSVMACYLPARRATRVDPAVAVREE
jgi:putative ABC transport system permease protein